MMCCALFVVYSIGSLPHSLCVDNLHFNPVESVWITCAVSVNQESVDWTAFLPFALSFFREIESEWSLSEIGSEGIPSASDSLANSQTPAAGRRESRRSSTQHAAGPLSAWRWRNDDDSIIWVFAFTRFQYKYRLGSACGGYSTSQCAGSVTASLLPSSLLTSLFPPPSGEQTAFRLSAWPCTRTWSVVRISPLPSLFSHSLPFLM